MFYDLEKFYTHTFHRKNMKLKNCLFNLILCLMLSATLSGCSTCYHDREGICQAGTNAASQPADNLEAIFNSTRSWPHERSDLDPDPTVIYDALDNGFRYILMKNPHPERRSRMHLFVQAGSMHEYDSEKGAAHFLEHLLFCGSENFEPGELVKYFQSIGMQFGPDANAHTAFYRTVYDIDLPESDPESLQKGLLVMRDYAAGALILESEVDRERLVVLSEKRTRDSAGFRTFEKEFAFELPDALLSKRLPIGDETVLTGADRELLKSFYDAWYRPERMILILVGDIDTQIASELIKQRFSSIAPRAPGRAYPDPGVIEHSGINCFYHYEPEAGNTSISIEVVSRKIVPPDTLQTQRQNLVASMADQIVSNRLAEMIENPQTPFTQASIDSGNYLQYLKVAEISADCAPEKWEKTLSALEQTLRQALEYGFTAFEIDIVKKNFIAQLERAEMASSTRDSKDITSQIIHSLDNGRVFQSPQQRKSMLMPMIEAITAKELHDSLAANWEPDHRLILVSGNLKLIGQEVTPENQILNIHAESTRLPVEKPLEKEIIRFPYLPIPEKKGNIRIREEIADLGIVRVEFDNGVYLNIKKTDFKANQILASFAFGNGKSSEPQVKPGLAMLTQQVINLSGLGKITRDELQKTLAGKNTSVSFQVEEDHFVFSGQTIPDETPLLFQLVQAYLADPGFREDAYSLALNQFQQEYMSLMNSIEGGMPLKGARFLGGGDSRFGLTEYEKLRSVSLNDIRQWTQPELAGAPLEISIVGDVDVEATIGIAATYMGTLPDRRQAVTPDASRLPKFPAGESLTIPMPTKIEKGIVDVAFPTGDFWEIRRNRRLSILSEILNDRMRIRIRDEMGAAYSLDAYNAPSRAYAGYGALHAVVSNSPKNSDTVIKAVKEIVDDLVQNGIRPEEFDRALKPTLEQIKELVKTNPYWLNSVLKGSTRHPEQLDFSRSFQADYAAITVDEVYELAKEYLKNQSAAVVVIEPEKTE